MNAEKKTPTETDRLLQNPISRRVISSGLSGFSLLSRIAESTEEKVAASADFDNAPPYLGVEALAQAGAYHVRFLCGFEKQAVLLMIRNCSLPVEEILSSRCELVGHLRSRSASVFAYEMSAEMNGVKVLDGDFVFTAIAYNSDLRKDILKEYYEKKWANLRND